MNSTNRLLVLALAVTVPIVLGGSTSQCSAPAPNIVAAPVNLPDLPAEATKACPRPVAKPGENPVAPGMGWKAKAGCEGNGRAALIVFYRDLRKGLGPQ